MSCGLVQRLTDPALGHLQFFCGVPWRLLLFEFDTTDSVPHRLVVPNTTGGVVLFLNRCILQAVLGQVLHKEVVSTGESEQFKLMRVENLIQVLDVVQHGEMFQMLGCAYLAHEGTDKRIYSRRLPDETVGTKLIGFRLFSEFLQPLGLLS